ncbi:hypothetical protein CCP2SC5_190023 [Azospirillaceae bacterium]
MILHGFLLFCLTSVTEMRIQAESSFFIVPHLSCCQSKTTLLNFIHQSNNITYLVGYVLILDLDSLPPSHEAGC